MATSVPAAVMIEDYLDTHGPTKTAQLAKIAGIGETTARKVLTLMQRGGKVRKDGVLWAIAGLNDSAQEQPEQKPAPSKAPRHNDAAKRDGEVLSHLVDEGPRTRNEVASHFGVKPSEAYLSLFRLRKAGKVVKDGETWRVA